MGRMHPRVTKTSEERSAVHAQRNCTESTLLSAAVCCFSRHCTHPRRIQNKGLCPNWQERHRHDQLSQIRLIFSVENPGLTATLAEYCNTSEHYALRDRLCRCTERGGTSEYCGAAPHCGRCTEYCGVVPHCGRFVKYCDVSEALSKAQSYNSDRRQIVHPGLG